jgi:hypothetical protein
VARDAIARQYDVDKNRVELDIPAGLITFYAKKGQSIDLDKIRASIQATRLSGNTGMELNSLDVTAVGRARVLGPETRLSVTGSQQQFILADDPDTRPRAGEKTPFQRLREALARGERGVTVTGRVHGWSGPFPVFLRDLPAPPARKPLLLIVKQFQFVSQ